jgi:hypothetical protein
VSLVARVLEAHHLPTVIMGCAPDIAARCGAPRMLASDFPLGNSAGRPFDEPSQDQTLAEALALFESARDPGTIATSPLCWQQDDGWKRDFMNIEKLSNAQIDARREEFERQKRIASTIKQA